MSSQELDRMKHLNPANRKHFEGYIRHLELEQLKLTTIRTKVWRIHSLFRDTGYQDAFTLTREDIEDYFIQRRKTVSPFTLQGDIERKMLENAGLIDIDVDVDEKGPTTLEPVMCPRCRSMNSFDAVYCARCSMALNEQAVLKVEHSTDEAKGSEEYRCWLRVPAEHGRERLRSPPFRSAPGRRSSAQADRRRWTSLQYRLRYSGLPGDCGSTQ